jgi:hypothetical protein
MRLGILLPAVIGLTGLLVGVVAGSVALQPALSLVEGQTRWFMPNQLQTGELIGCVVNGREVEAKVPAASPRGSSGADLTFRGATAISIQRRSTGATQITCGAASTGGAVPRRGTLPYVIGQNGLGLIRGPNSFSALERMFGQPSTIHVGGLSNAHCSATWHTIGLTAVCVGRQCSGRDALLTATVRGSAWSSLTGVHIGDPIAEVAWEDPTAKLVSNANGKTSWQLASGGASHNAKLLAVGGDSGRVVSFVGVVS